MIIKRKTNKKLSILVNVVIILGLLNLLTVFWHGMMVKAWTDIPLSHVLVSFLVLCLPPCIVIIYLFKELTPIFERQNNFLINEETLAVNQRVIENLSTQRHDFHNHLQVVMGFIQINMLDEAVAYIKEVDGILKQHQCGEKGIKNLVISALLDCKMEEARERNVELILNLRSDLNGLTVPAAEVSSILSNLIDNAFDAVEELGQTDQKVVQVEFNEDNESFMIRVQNRGPTIPAKHQKHIFQKGFTTKGLGGNGLGLAIVKELTIKNGGNLGLESKKETGTLFTLAFPKNQISI